MASDGRGLLVLALGAGSVLAQGDAGFSHGAGVTQLGFTLGRAMAERVEVAGAGSEQIDIEQWSSSLYLSHGLSDSLGISGSITWIANDPAAAVDLPADSGLQDARIALRWRFLRSAAGPGDVSLVFTPGLEVPLRDYATDSVAAIGDGETTISYGMVCQYRWHAGPFVAIEGCFRDDLGTTADACLFGLTVGHRVLEPLSATAYTYRVVGTGGEDLVSLGRGRGQGHGQGQGSNTTSSFDLGTIDQSYTMLGFAVQLDLAGGTAATMGYARTIETENTAESSGFSIGLVHSFGG